MAIDIGGGVLHKEIQEISIPGKFPLQWIRNYTTAAADGIPSPLGRGWANPYYCSLRYEGDAYHFVGPNGTTETFPDPDARLERGGLLINLGAFHDLHVSRGEYVVRHWNLETGDVTHYVFHAETVAERHLLRAIEDPTGQGLDLEYDRGWRLSAIRQRLEGRVLALDHDASGLVQSVSLRAPSGATYPLVRYRHDESGCLVAAADAAGLEDRYEYDRAGRITRELIKDGGVFSMRYDARGRCVYISGLDRYDEKRLRFIEAARLVEVTDSTGAVWRYRCLPSGQIAEEINPLGGSRQMAYDEAGRLVAITDENGGVVSCSYDAAGNRDSITDAMGQEFRLTYSPAHLPLSMTDPLGGTSQREYDPANRLVRTTDAAGASWRYGYDADGNMTRVEDPVGAVKALSFVRGVLTAGTDWLGHVSRYAFDDFGRLVQKVDPLGFTTRLGYDVWGNITAIHSPDGSIHRMESDGVGNLVRYIDADGSTTRFMYGPCGMLQEKIEPDGSRTTYRWSTEPDRLVEIVNERGERLRFVRDDLGNLVEEIGFDGRSTCFAYDPAGRVAAMINGNGERVVHTHDAVGRLTGLLLPDGTQTRYAWDPLGNMIAAANQHVRLQFERDAVGRLRREFQGEHWVSSTYDLAGHLVGTETSRGHSVEYAVDANGDVTGITAAGGALSITRDAKRLESQRQLSGNVVLDVRHDAAGRLREQTLRMVENGDERIAGRPPLLVRRYDYEITGQLKTVTDNTWNTKQYTYDGVEQVRAVDASGTVSEGFDYDSTGNIVRMLRSPGSAGGETLGYDAGNRLASKDSTAYRFDPHGRLVVEHDVRDTDAVHGVHYRWNALDQLTDVTTTPRETWSYAYDPLGRRISKTRDGTLDTTFLWDRDCLIHEVTADGVTSWVYESDNLAPLARVDRHGMAGVICDHLGTPVAFVRDRRPIVTRAPELTAWGETAAGRNVEPCNLRFQGQYFDAETRLHNSRFRYYSPGEGRFISQDPLGMIGGLNFYAYAPNPINFVDPYGLSTSSDSAILGDNLRDAKQKPPGPNHDAHHIVQSNSTDSRMQTLQGVLTGHGIDINDPRNGIWLPRKSGDRVPNDTRTAHKGEGLHGDAYKQHVHDTIMAGAPPPPSKREVLARLKKLKGELAQGKKFPCKR
jgi:RHS repeat-associated protein